MNVFPINLYEVSRHDQWFSKFYADHREELIKNHGSYHFTGNAVEDREKKFSYYEASVIFTSPTSVTVRFHDMEDPCYGGRGRMICEIKGTVEIDDRICGIIDGRMHDLAVMEYERREEERLAKLREVAIAQVKKELFSDFKY